MLILIHDEDDKEFITTYEYNKNNKLLKTIDYNGIVTENVYNDKGVVTKTLTYHINEPTRKFYSETPTDEKGNTTASVNHRNNLYRNRPSQQQNLVRLRL